nr:MetaGeneMark_Unknown Function [uncultured bacterium]
MATSISHLQPVENDKVEEDDAERKRKRAIARALRDRVLLKTLINPARRPQYGKNRLNAFLANVFECRTSMIRWGEDR